MFTLFHNFLNNFVKIDRLMRHYTQNINAFKYKLLLLTKNNEHVIESKKL